MVDLNAHETGNGGKKPREAYSLPKSPLLGSAPLPRLEIHQGHCGYRFFLLRFRT